MRRIRFGYAKGNAPNAAHHICNTGVHIKEPE